MAAESSLFRRFPSLGLPLAFLLLLLLLPLLPHFPAARSTSIYDHLHLNGLPIGLLPKGISDFSLDPQTRRFQINLPQPCNAKFESEVHYDLNVSGVLSYGKIDQLSGMSQQELFLWFPVKGIRVDDPDSGLIHFDVGVVDKQFSLSLFESPRDCTAGDPHVSPHSLTGTLEDQPEQTRKSVQEDMLRAAL